MQRKMGLERLGDSAGGPMVGSRRVGTPCPCGSRATTPVGKGCPPHELEKTIDSQQGSHSEGAQWERRFSWCLLPLPRLGLRKALPGDCLQRYQGAGEIEPVELHLQCFELIRGL